MASNRNRPEDGDPGAAGDERLGGGTSVATVPRRRRDWRAVWGPMAAQAHAEAEQRRARVLAYPDLATRLTEQPIGYARPGQWSGYVPPAMWGYAQSPRDRSAGRELRNDSPRRAALVELCADALQREQEGVGA